MIKNKALVTLLASPILLSIFTIFILSKKDSRLSTLSVFPQRQSKYEIFRPTEEELYQAFQNAEYETRKYEIPVDRIVDLVHPVFYPPNGF